MRVVSARDTAAQYAQPGERVPAGSRERQRQGALRRGLRYVAADLAGRASMTTPVPGLESPGGLVGSELRDAWPFLDAHEKVEGFHLLAPAEEEDFFLSLEVFAQMQLLEGLPAAERQIWMRQLPPDDAADLIQVCPETQRGAYLALLDDHARSEVLALMAYAEDAAGGLMSPRFARVRPDMTADEAIRYLRRQARQRV